MDITYIIQTMERTILEQEIGNHHVQEFQGIILLKNQSRLLEQYLYVGHYSDGLRLLDRCGPDQSVTMFLSAEDVNHTALPPCGRNNLVVSTLDIFDLYNRINIIIQNYLYWSNRLREALCLGQTLPQLLNTAADMIRSPIWLFNPGYRQIAGSTTNYFEEPIGRELAEHGSLAFETVRSLQNTDQPGDQLALEEHYHKTLLNNISYHICEIHSGSRHLATALLAENPENRDIDYRHLLLDFCEIAAHSMRENLELLLNQDALCSAFLQDIIEERLTDGTAIQARLDRLPYPSKAFCCFVLVRLDRAPENPETLGFLMQRLQTVFPENNMAIYDHDIVILYSQTDRPQGRMDFDYEKLQELMEQFHAHAGVSNASRHRPRLRTLYSIASATIRLGKALHRFSPTERVFSYEDYSMYYIIDLCATHYIDIHHHNDLIYLVHPSIIKICRYDAEHKSNLRDVLYYYLLSGCSLNRTAQTMYMHRNTVLNKLNKINEITEIPLEDGYTRHRMIMSCLVMRYYEDYLHQTIRL